MTAKDPRAAMLSGHASGTAAERAPVTDIEAPSLVDLTSSPLNSVAIQNTIQQEQRDASALVWPDKESIEELERRFATDLIPLKVRFSGPIESTMGLKPTDSVTQTEHMGASSIDTTEITSDTLSGLSLSKSVAPKIPDPASARDMDQAERLIDLGDISGARLLLNAPVELGYARALLLLAKSYDPRYMPLRRYGIHSDESKADALYRQAKTIDPEPSPYQAALARQPARKFPKEQPKFTTVVNKTSAKPNASASPKGLPRTETLRASNAR